MALTALTDPQAAAEMYTSRLRVVELVCSEKNLWQSVARVVVSSLLY